MDCLDDNTILDYLEGRLKPEAETTIRAHVDTCDDCRALLSEATKSFLQGQASDQDNLPPLSRGHNVGRYIVLHVIGAGAMGVVYAAYDPELDRKVALKLLRDDVGTGEGSGSELRSSRQKRLLREAQAMARLSHPNVVTVFDAGTIEGQVFLTMEFVDGGSLGEWIRQESRPWQKVLAAYVRAGRGLSAAHAAGLVHRDFKPDNVLIGKDGRVLVTDFGLARAERVSLVKDEATKVGLLAPPSSQLSLLTQEGTIAGTPAYMPPEQLRGKPADAKSDQFTFAVALWEGLYGKRPYVAPTLEELVRVMESGQIRDRKGPKHVPHAVRRVLERALRPNPDARYPTLEAMLRSLSRAPIVRYAPLAAAVLGFMVSLLLFGGARLLRAPPAVSPEITCGSAERKLAGIWDRERRTAAEKAFSETHLSFAADTWKRVDHELGAYRDQWIQGHKDACEATHVRKEQSEQLLDLRMECLGDRLEELRALTNLLVSADGKIVERAVFATEALSPVSDCQNGQKLKASRRKPITDPALARDVSEVTAVLAQAKALEDSGKYKDALLLAEGAKARARTLQYLPLEAESLHRVGRISGWLEDGASAESNLTEAARAAEASEQGELAARTYIDLIYFVGYRQAKHEKGEAFARYAEAAMTRIGGHDELAAERLLRLGVLLWSEGKLAEAKVALEQAQPIFERRLGPEHFFVAKALEALAFVETERGAPKKALSFEERAVDIFRKARGEGHPETALSLSNLSEVLFNVGRYQDSLDAAERSLVLTENNAGPESPELVFPLLAKSLPLLEEGRSDDVLAVLLRAQKILQKANDTSLPEYGQTLLRLGSAERRAGRAKKAHAYLEEAKGSLEKVLGGSHPDVASCLVEFGELALLESKAKEAVSYAERARSMLDSAKTPLQVRRARVFGLLGRAKRAQGDFPAAVDVLEQGRILHQSMDADPYLAAEHLFWLAEALWDNGDTDTALTHAREAERTFGAAPFAAERRERIRVFLSKKR